MHRIALYDKATLAKQGNCLGQKLPFRFFHYPTLEAFRRIAGPDGDCFLKDDRPAVTDFIDKMDRRTR